MQNNVRQFEVALVQMAMGADSSANATHAAEFIGQAADAGANVVCLPELHQTPYFCQREDSTLFDWAETIPGPSTARYGDLAREHNITLVVSLFEHAAPGLYYNTAVVLGPDGAIIGRYRKSHIPDDPGYYEKFYFTPGEGDYQGCTSPHGHIATLVCWDQWFPEAARLAAMNGANVIFYPTAIGWHPQEDESVSAQQRDAWQTIQRGHAIANGVFVAAVNRVGLERDDVSGSELRFWGSSMLVDPFGVVLAEGPVDKEAIVTATVNVDRIEQVRRDWPFWRDRRIDTYDDLRLRYKSATLPPRKES